jgi:rSAM/selenodomain-associated transferase 1
MFAKVPSPGRVKTRLAQEIGAERAVAIYRAVGARVAAAVGRRYDLSVWYDPPDGLSEMRSWLGDHEYLSQPVGDLGARLECAFRTHFDRGDGPVIAIGADIPGIDAATIADAEAALQRASVVLGPAQDGGYYLIGLRGPVPELFVGVPWSSERVFQVTLEICHRLHLEVVGLEMLRDVDTAADAVAQGLVHS